MAQAQRLYARDLPDLQHNKMMTSEGMKGVSDLDRSQRLTGQCAVRSNRANRAGSLHPASGDAGPAEAMEPDVLPIQLWVPTAAVGASCRGSSAAVHRARLRMGDRPRFGKILRSSQSRQTDGPNCQARRGQAAAEAHPGLPECRGDGEWTGQPERGRDPARRSAFATAQ